jgi:hypothetical protein
MAHSRIRHGPAPFSFQFSRFNSALPGLEIDTEVRNLLSYPDQHIDSVEILCGPASFIELHCIRITAHKRLLSSISIS